MPRRRGDVLQSGNLFTSPSHEPHAPQAGNRSWFNNGALLTQGTQVVGDSSGRRHLRSQYDEETLSFDGAPLPHLPAGVVPSARRLHSLETAARAQTTTTTRHSPRNIRVWRRAPPQQSANRLAGLLAPPQHIPNSRTAPLVDAAEVSGANVLMIVAKRPPSSRVVHIYNGVSNKVVALRVAASGLHAEGATTRAGNLFTIEVFPGETEVFYSCGAESVVRPGFVLNTIPPSLLSAKTLFLRKRSKQEKAHLISSLSVELSGPEPESAVLNSAARVGTPFVDLWFPPEAGAAEMGVEVVWGRPNAFLAEPATLLAGLPAPNNIERGPAGSATFLCAAGILAEFPSPLCPHLDFISGIFAPHTAAHLEAGCVKIQLCVDGWWRTIVMDTYLPLVGIPTHSVLIPAATRPITKLADLWVSYVEKGYAKELGSYASLHEEPPSVMLSDLTGYPSEALPLQGERTPLFEDIEEWFGRGFIVAFRTGGRARRGGPMRSVDVGLGGLLAGHVYYLLQVLNVSGLRLLHIRNPWGRGVEWDGEYGWRSALWTKELLSACGVAGDTAGTFVVSWEELKACFVEGVVTYCVPNAGEVRLSLPLVPSPAFVVELAPHVPLRVYVSVTKLRTERSSAEIIISILEPADATSARYTYREEVGGVAEKCFLSVYEVEAGALPSFICVRPGGGGAASELVVTLLYAPLDGEHSGSKGSVTLREALPFFAAVTAAASTGADVIDLSQVRAGTVETWVQARKQRALPVPWKSEHVNHIIL